MCLKIIVNQRGDKSYLYAVLKLNSTARFTRVPSASLFPALTSIVLKTVTNYLQFNHRYRISTAILRNGIARSKASIEASQVVQDFDYHTTFFYPAPYIYVSVHRCQSMLILLFTHFMGDRVGASLRVLIKDRFRDKRARFASCVHSLS